MKKFLTVILLSLATFAQAENLKKAYVIGETEMLDIDKLQPHRTKFPETLKPYGRRFLVRDAEPIMLEGQASKGHVVIIKLIIWCWQKNGMARLLILPFAKFVKAR